VVGKTFYAVADTFYGVANTFYGVADTFYAVIVPVLEFRVGFLELKQRSTSFSGL
jgi:hypothetical protein